MDSTQIALLITAICGGIGGLITAIAALLKIRTESAFGAHERDELKQQIDAGNREREQLKQELAEVKRASQVRDDLARTNIILLGESMGGLRNDNAKLALLVNQLFNQFQTATGRRPDVDLEMLKHMRTIEYITGPLGPLEVPEQ
jgi:gas vesicle protein